MNFLRLKNELELIAGDRLAENYASWLNNAVLELAADFEFPALKLREPVLFVTKDTQWIYYLPNTDRKNWATSTAYVAGDNVVESGDVYNCILEHTSGSTTRPGTGVSWETYWELITSGTAIYQKKLFKVLSETWDGSEIKVYDSFRPIEEQDYDHDDTGDYVESIGVEDKQIAIYPMANDVLQMWFYRRPIDMTEEHDLPDGIPEEYHRRVILPKVVLQNFEILQNMAMNAPQNTLRYWQDKYEEGLYGTPRGDIGMVRYLAKFKGGPKVRGGRDTIM